MDNEDDVRTVSGEKRPGAKSLGVPEMVHYQRILVPLDGSPLAEKALPPARSLAKGLATQLILLRVVEPHETLSGRAAGWEAAAREAARDYLEEQAESLTGAGIAAKVEVVHGEAATAILDYAEAERVDLIVLSSHGRSGLNRWLRGSVATKVLHHARCDLLLIYPQARVAPFSNNRLLLALDGSKLAEAALPPAVAIARAMEAEVHVLRVASNVEDVAPPAYRADLEEILVAEYQHGRSYQERVAAALAEEGLRVETAVEWGSAAEEIVTYAAAHEVDLIVLSSHGSSGPTRWLLGSVTEKVLSDAGCATLVVKVPR